MLNDTCSPRPLRVMLLDDDTFMLDVLHGMLDEIGTFEVLRETCARQALRALPVDTPDLLVCDLSLPEMDGIEFMQAAARSGFPGDVLLVSGLDKGVRYAAERLASAYGLRVLGSFAKPLSLDALRGVMEMLAATRPRRSACSGRAG
ncbi:response regulator [Massilia sp. R798]|uniref:Response regulator n=2 Tax=Massilia soli TaxID=2792854 RepID=A0ABS7SP82_9BURK|nr:response regulator [Massilia soli]